MHCEALKLDGLIVVGGDDSNTNACLLAEYFLKEKCTTRIVGCPKTIDGDLKNEYVETSFGNYYLRLNYIIFNLLFFSSSKDLILLVKLMRK